MDSVTQFLLGAAVGEAVAGKKAGGKALLWGGVGGIIPDLDVAAGQFMHVVDEIAFHRGMTHSIFFAAILAPAVGWGLRRLYRHSAAGWRDWTLLMFLSLTTHALLDCFTTWGTQLFWPFSEYRVAFKSIFVIDPLYTLPLLVCLAWAVFLPKDAPKRRTLNAVGLALSSFYLLTTVFVKSQANEVFEGAFEKQEMNVSRYETKPAPFNIILWSATAESEDGYYMGYYSFMDDDKAIDYHFFEKNHEALRHFVDDEHVQKLIDITGGWYTVEPADSGVILNDLRFGQRSGWERGEGDFVFSYHIFEENGDVTVEEVERDFSEAREMLKPLWDRIWGK